MLTHLLAAGFIASSSSGGGGTGIVIATPNRTAILSAVQPASSLSAAIPAGAPLWAQHFDPGDHAPYAFDFTALLGDGEKIASIDAIKMSAQAALLGVAVDQASVYAPIIDEAGKKLQLWFIVDMTSWEAVAFAAGGVMLPVTVRILTDSVPPKRFERTSALTVRQL
jgi:hypothetical protein